MNNYRNNLISLNKAAASGSDYKFVTRIEITDGGNGANAVGVLETFELYGCYVDANYNQLAYGTSDPVTVTLQLRYDNAIPTQGTGVGTAVGRTTKHQLQAAVHNFHSHL